MVLPSQLGSAAGLHLCLAAGAFLVPSAIHFLGSVPCLFMCFTLLFGPVSCRNGAFNCLVATCIGEEGLDIPQVQCGTAGCAQGCLHASPVLAPPDPWMYRQHAFLVLAAHSQL